MHNAYVRMYIVQAISANENHPAECFKKENNVLDSEKIFDEHMYM